MVVSIQEPEYKNTLLTVVKNDLPVIIPFYTGYGFLSCNASIFLDLSNKPYTINRHGACVIPE